MIEYTKPPLHTYFLIFPIPLILFVSAVYNMIAESMYSNIFFFIAYTVTMFVFIECTIFLPAGPAHVNTDHPYGRRRYRYLLINNIIYPILLTWIPTQLYYRAHYKIIPITQDGLNNMFLVFILMWVTYAITARLWDMYEHHRWKKKWGIK